MIKNIIVTAGARPNFIKIVRLVDLLKRDKRFSCRLVHTGQHYDLKMSDVFFRDLNIPRPDIFLRRWFGFARSTDGEDNDRFRRRSDLREA